MNERLVGVGAIVTTGVLLILMHLTNYVHTVTKIRDEYPDDYKKLGSPHVENLSIRGFGLAPLMITYALCKSSKPSLKKLGKKSAAVISLYFIGIFLLIAMYGTLFGGFN